MEWRELFEETPPVGSDESGPGQLSPNEETSPKNGRLTLAVVGSILLMIGLAALNVRLIRDPSIAGKSIRVSDSSQPFLECLLPPPLNKSSREDKPVPHVPPVVDFYKKLTEQEEHDSLAGSGAEGEPQGGVDAARQGSGVAAATDRKGDANFQQPAMSGGSGVPRVNEEAALSAIDRRQKTYTVQVGAFSHPGIAQEWALKWKSRGYDVSLKPVARPKTGVIYRLYLGKFPSEKEADDLVKHLKAKEGISAFWLAVR